MAAGLIDGKAYAAALRDGVSAAVAELGGGIGLATVLVGDDPASSIYVRRKQEACRGAGIEPFHHELPAETSQGELVGLVGELNRDDRVTGVLVQLPLPAHIDEGAVIQSIAPIKDVDGLHPVNAGHLLQGTEALVPATPVGIMQLLSAYDVDLLGARAVVLGRSNLVGKPVALLLLAAQATVTICHSRTERLGEVVREADVVVAAVGRPGVVDATMVKPGATVIDVGVNRTDDGVVGDVSPGVEGVAGLLTPVPGGVGPMTIAALLQNTLKAARYQRGLSGFPG